MSGAYTGIEHLVVQCHLCGPIAQLVEQQTLNLRVVGSTPTRLSSQCQCRHVEYAKVVELVDTQDLGSCAERCKGSSPFFRTCRQEGLAFDNREKTVYTVA